MDLDGERVVVFVALQLLTQQIFAPYQDDSDSQTFCGSNRAIDFWFRGLVPAHGVDCDGQHSLEIAVSVTAGTLFLLDFDYLTAFVLAAMRARAVR
jgi:hypothetical protein